MSETPFRIGQTTVGNPCVQNATGEILDVCINEEHARKSLGDALRVWHYAGGPALTRQRDELLYLLTEVANSGVEIELPKYRTVQIDNVTWDRIAAAIGGGA